MAESNNTKKPTREELTAILSGFKDVTNQRGGVLIIGGVRPRQKQEKQPDESMKKPEEH